MENQIIIFGAGGHGKAIYNAIATGNSNQPLGQRIYGWIDDVRNNADESDFYGRPILGGKAWLDSTANADMVIEQKLKFIIAIGDNHARAQIYDDICEKFSVYNVSEYDLFATVIHPFSSIAGDAEIAPGVVVMPGAVVQAAAKISANVIINTGALIDHDVIIGRHSHIAPNAALCGGVQIGEQCLIGVGSSVIPKIKIGNGVTIGAGAAIVNDIADGKIVTGVPAR